MATRGPYKLCDLSYLFLSHNFDKILAPVVRRLDSAIHWINHYPLNNSIDFPRVYPLDRHLLGGYRYPPFEQPRPEVLFAVILVSENDEFERFEGFGVRPSPERTSE